MAAKINMRLDKNEMPSQDPNVRNKNFLEVALGYTEEQALDEAARCLNCKNDMVCKLCEVSAPSARALISAARTAAERCSSADCSTVACFHVFVCGAY